MNKAWSIVMLGLSLLIWSSDGLSQEPPLTGERPPVSDFNIQLLDLGGPTWVASIPGAGVRSGRWVNGNLRRIAEWKPSKEVPAEVAVLLIEFWLDGGAVKLEVTAYLGNISPNSRPPDWEKLVNAKVASRLLNEDQMISITETERFGIEPFSVKVSRAKPWSIGVPEIINKTQALTVIGLTEERPTYTLTVRNVSHKIVSGIDWYGTTDRRTGGSTGLNGARVIGAGKVFEIHQRFDFAEARPEAAETAQAPKRAIVIAAIVFEDGTFEGEPDKSAEISASIAGHRIQYLRALELLRGLSLTPGDDQVKIFSKLKQEIASLSEAADQEVVKELVTRFATASEDMRNRRIKELVSHSLKSAKMHLLQLVERFEFQRSNSPDEADLGSWLKKTTEELENSTGSN